MRSNAALSGPFGSKTSKSPHSPRRCTFPPALGTRADRLQLRLLHDEDEVKATGERGRELAGAVARDVETALAQELLRHWMSGLPDSRRDTRRFHHGVQVTALQSMGEQALGHRATADVSVADQEDPMKYTYTFLCWWGCKSRRVGSAHSDQLASL